ncbi:MAG: hypothetical protein AAGJ28_00995 [Pseudomonadota bacterium]
MMRPIFLACCLSLLTLLMPLSASAITVQFFSTNFTVSGPASVTGSFRGQFDVQDRDGNGNISAQEILSFSFTSDFTDPALQFSGDAQSFSVFALSPPEVPRPLVQDLSWDGFGLLRLGQGSDPFGDLAMVVLAPDRTGLLRTGQTLITAIGGAPQLVNSAPPIGAIPLPGSLVLLLGALGIFAGVAGVRRTQSLAGRGALRTG